MTDKYAGLRKATQIRNIFCSPEAIFGYRAAAHPEAIRANDFDGAVERARAALAQEGS